jgi:hypothetical protein
MFDGAPCDGMTVVDVGSSATARRDEGITVLVADRRISVTLGASNASGRSAVVVLANGSVRVSVIRAPLA